jgi:alpha-1,6-mannosyltransferase
MKLLDYLLLLVVTLYIVICPFNKVEESFNTQAIHDLLFHSNNLTQFDHHEFPGVVPRTFLGPIIISTIVKPFTYFFSSDNKFLILLFSRFVLGALCIFCQSLFRDSIRKKFGESTSNFYALVLLSQFHLLFYMSRTLPNTFALVFTFIGFKYWLDEEYPRMFFVLGVTASIFRGELFALIFPISLYAVITRKINLFFGILIGLLSVLFGAGIDLFFHIQDSLLL